ncbi:MAG: flagellar biosynthetic protein FliO [Hydrogenophaga sp.]|jgi:flagellar protein FliO/FliZ|uniref:FliO/MopB family protein n=1 Tax=Hydrogenophaga sp. TaxID=1904254 RepID=UPI002611F500|nr:flagellar biosynthetic protein FliO [Hydrogenophaga sp.]MCV0439271.1 flagellar biosynthetic protein FliO [Hydrogenophaga sp.]
MLQNAIPALVLLALMVGIAFALKWARLRLPGAVGHSGPPMQVLSSLSLGPQQRVVTVQVGQGDAAVCLVLGVSAGSVNALHQMPLPAGMADAGTPIVTPATGFAARLAQLTQPNKAHPHAPR